MANNLARDLVSLGNRGLGSHGRAKLSLNHRERTFDVGTPMVASQEFAPIKFIEMEHPAPQFRAIPGGIDLEGYVGCSPSIYDRLQVALADIALVCGYFDYLKALRRRFQKWRQVRIVIGFRAG